MSWHMSMRYGQWLSCFDSCQLTILWMSNVKDVDLARHAWDTPPFLLIVSPTPPVQSVDAYVRTYARSITWQPNEKRLTIFYEYGALSARGSPATNRKRREMQTRCQQKTKPLKNDPLNFSYYTEKMNILLNKKRKDGVYTLFSFREALVALISRWNQNFRRTVGPTFSAFHDWSIDLCRLFSVKGAICKWDASDTLINRMRLFFFFLRIRQSLFSKVSEGESTQNRIILQRN